MFSSFVSLACVMDWLQKLFKVGGSRAPREQGGIHKEPESAGKEEISDPR